MANTDKFRFLDIRERIELRDEAVNLIENIGERPLRRYLLPLLYAQMDAVIVQTTQEAPNVMDSNTSAEFFLGLQTGRASALNDLVMLVSGELDRREAEAEAAAESEDDDE